MRIGIDARMYRSGVAGIGRYSQNLIKYLLELDKENEYILFMTDEDKREFEISKSKYQMSNKIQSQNVKIVITNIKHYSLSEQIKLPKIIAREKLDLMHFLNFNYPVFYRGKFISVIHDLTLVKFPSTAKRTNFLKKMAFNFVLKKAVQNSQKVIAISQNTKKDIVQTFQTDPGKIIVIYEAVNDKIMMECDQKNIDRLKNQYKITAPVILYVGQFRPHKNLPGLVEAFDLVRSQRPCHLIMVGKPDPDHHRLSESIDKSPYKSDIVMPGFVTDEELACWYKLASVFVFPSAYEGFGLPGLEAMAAGTPVAAANNSALPEIYADAAVYFDPFKSQEIADKMKMILGDEKLRLDLIQKGKKRVQEFSWEKMARETMEVYREILTK